MSLPCTGRARQVESCLDLPVEVPVGSLDYSSDGRLSVKTDGAIVRFNHFVCVNLLTKFD